MNKASQELLADLKNGVTLAELGGHGDGPYCAQHGAGAALVWMGTYIVDPGDKVPYPKHFVFKPDPAVYRAYLREHVTAARAGGAKIGVSIISVELQHTLDFIVAAQDAGADSVSLCAHSVMDMFLGVGLGEALCEPANAKALRKWAGAMVGAVTIPVAFKIGLLGLQETIAAVETLTEIGVSIVSINVGETGAGTAGLRAVKELAGRSPCLMAGGGIRTLADARRVLGEGADAVAIGTAAMKNPCLCGEIQKGLR